MAANIDELQIEITAESTSAVKKVNALCKALERLKAVTESNFGDVSGKIRSIGDAAESAAAKAGSKKEKSKSPSKGPKASSKTDSSPKSGIDNLRSKLKGLDSVKVKLADELKRAEIQAVRTDGTLDSMKQKLQGLQGKDNLGDSAKESIETASNSIEEFAKKSEAAQEKAKELREALEFIKSSPVDLKADNAASELESLTEIVKSVIEEYKDLQHAAKLAGESAKNALGSAASTSKTDVAKDSPAQIEKLEFGDVDVGKTKDGVDGLSESLEKATSEAESLGKTLSDVPKLDFEEQDVSGTTEDVKEISNAVKEAATDSESLKRALESLNSIKLQITNELQRAELQSVKTANKIGGMERTLSAIGAKDNLSESAKSALEAASSAVSKFKEDVKGAENAVQEIQDAFESIENTEIDASTEEGQKQIEALAAKVQELIEKYRELSRVASVSGETAKGAVSNASFYASHKDVTAPDVGVDTDGAAKKAGILRRVLESLKETKFGSAIAKQAQEGESGIQKMADALRSQRSLWTDIAPSNLFKKLESGLAATMSAFPKFGSAVKGLKYAFNTVTQPAFKLLSALKNIAKVNLSKLVSSLKSAASAGIGKMASGFKSIGRSVANHIVNPFKRAISTVSQWKSTIGRIAFYRMVRSAIKAVTDGFRVGIQNLYQYSKAVGTEFAPAMDRLATSAQYLKNSLGAMAAPLIQALAPAIDYLIDKVVALLNVIGKLFAVLTGKGVFTQAKKQAASFGGAVGGAAGAAKELKNYLLGIDELNVLDDKDHGGGGGGGGGADFSDMFEEVDIEGMDWAKRMKEAIDAGDWYGAGAILADHLNEVIAAWDSYEWGRKLGEKITNGLEFALGFLRTFDFEALGSKIAGFFNGIFDSVDFDTLGRVMAAKWNALFDAIYGFATTLNWAGIGLNISQALNGWVDEINWDMIGQSLSAAIEGLFTAASAAISGTDWYALFAGIAEAINSIDFYGLISGAAELLRSAFSALIDSVTSLVRSLEWRRISNEVVQAINDAFSDSSLFAKAGTAAGDFLKKIFEFLRSTIAGINWKQIGIDLLEFLKGIDWNGVFTSAGQVIGESINAIVDILAGLTSDEAFWSGLGTSIGNGIVTLFQTIDWENAGTVLNEMFTGVLNGINSAIEDKDWNEIGQAIGNFLGQIEWGTIIEELGSIIWNAFTGLIEGLFGSENGKVILGITAGLAALALLFQAPGVISAIGGLVASAISSLGGLLAAIGPAGWAILAIGAGVALIVSHWDDIKKAAGELKEKVSEKWEEIKSDAKEKWESIKSAVNEKWEKIKSDAQKKFEEIRKKISDKWEEVKKNTKEKWENIKKDVNDKWDAIKKDATTKFEGVRKNIADKWEETKKNANEKWENIKSDVNDFWDKISGDATKKFETTRKNIADKWDEAKRNANEKWETIKSEVGGLWDKIAGDATDKFETVRGNIESKWTDVSNNATTAWNTISGKLETAWGSLSGVATRKFTEVSSAISGAWSSITSKAVQWGLDLGSNLASGIRSAISTVSGAASSLAQSVKNKIGHSVPKEGPLKDELTYMPDMMQNLAKGIRDNESIVLNPISDLANSMSKTFKDLSYSVEFEEPKGLPNSVLNGTMQYVAELSDNTDRAGMAEDFAAGNRQGNSELIGAVQAGFAAVIAAVNENGGDVYLDGKALMRSVEKAQKQRGANIMAGGVRY